MALSICEIFWWKLQKPYLKSRRFKVKKIFLRVLARSGKNVAAIALARKALCILYHLLMKREEYQEPDVNKTKPKIPSCISPVSLMNIDEMIKIISKGRIHSEKRLEGGMRVTAPVKTKT